MSAFPITKAKEAPQPKPAVRRWKQHRYPFAIMEVGDMFFLPNRSENTFTAYASQFGRKLGRSFSTRLCWCRRENDESPWTPCEKDAPGAVQGIGVWRAADPA